MNIQSAAAETSNVEWGSKMSELDSRIRDGKIFLARRHRDTKGELKRVVQASRLCITFLRQLP
ncbi:MAG TPA: hypothetical protein DET40_25620 [Lentisphaeria bacterium]|nr:MAG: hypothetical protein A2X45_14705 [Lentisphaerae bacterium GWF2_50_93]HCE46940.1 hypothetical protein [Lentisphaeria bacterium]